MIPGNKMSSVESDIATDSDQEDDRTQRNNRTSNTRRSMVGSNGMLGAAAFTASVLSSLIGTTAADAPAVTTKTVVIESPGIDHSVIAIGVFVCLTSLALLIALLCKLINCVSPLIRTRRRRRNNHHDGMELGNAGQNAVLMQNIVHDNRVPQDGNNGQNADPMQNAGNGNPNPEVVIVRNVANNGPEDMVFDARQVRTNRTQGTS